jgi:hypothetical protein
MYKELVDITGKETKASHILKLIGIHGTFESGRRQIAVLRMFPNDPVKVMEYIDIIWYVIFGAKLDEYELEKIVRTGKKYPDLVFHISKCPICGGYGSSPLDSIDCNKIEPEESFYATGLVGMLEETANFILELKKNDYRILMKETKCFCRGDSELELYCNIMHKSEFNKTIQNMDESLNIPFLEDSEIEESGDLLSKPLEALKEQIISSIQDKLQMSTYDVMEYFQGYEEDVVRIIGFMGVHLLNENGRVIEKVCENESFSKLIGHIYNNSLEMAKLTLPFEVIEDYKKFIIDILTDVAPPDIIDHFTSIPPTILINLFYEGVKKALIDLGTNFEGLKRNIWEEMEVHRILNPSSNEKDGKSLTEEEKKEKIKLQMDLLQQLSILLMGIMAFPNKIFLSTLHSSAKSVISAGKENTSTLREQITSVLELIEKLK